MGLRLKILVALAVFLTAVLSTESVLLVRGAASRLRGAQTHQVSQIAVRLALAVERAGRPGPLPSREPLERLLQDQLGQISSSQRQRPPLACAVQLLDAQESPLVTVGE